MAIRGIVSSIVFVSIVVTRMMALIVPPLVCEVRIAVIVMSIRGVTGMSVSVMTVVIHATDEAKSKYDQNESPEPWSGDEWFQFHDELL